MRFTLLVLVIICLHSFIHCSNSFAANDFDPSIVNISPTESAEIDVEAILKNNSFKINRKLDDYFSFFEGTDFRKKLFQFQLRKKTRWIDMGAGEARAIEDALKRKKKIRAIAVSYEEPADSFKPEGKLKKKFEYISGNYVEKMEDQFKNSISKIDIITDLYGPLSYSKEILPLFEIYFKLLKNGGSLYFYLGGENFNDFFREQSKIPEGLFDWLKTIQGIQIKYSTHSTCKHMMRSNNDFKCYLVQIKKHSEDIRFQTGLSNISFKEGSPPSRTFRLQ